MPIIVGLIGRAETVVTDQNTAAAMGSGSLPVFATPAMAALMEQASCDALNGALEPGETTVGIALELTHDAATPLGLTVRAEATVTAVDGKCISFTVAASDSAGSIGKAAHRRFIVTADRFLSKAAQKKEV